MVAISINHDGIRRHRTGGTGVRNVGYLRGGCGVGVFGQAVNGVFQASGAGAMQPYPSFASTAAIVIRCCPVGQVVVIVIQATLSALDLKGAMVGDLW